MKWEVGLDDIQVFSYKFQDSFISCLLNQILFSSFSWPGWTDFSTLKINDMSQNCQKIHQVTQILLKIYGSLPSVFLIFIMKAVTY